MCRAGIWTKGFLYVVRFTTLLLSLFTCYFCYVCLLERLVCGWFVSDSWYSSCAERWLVECVFGVCLQRLSVRPLQQRCAHCVQSNPSAESAAAHEKGCAQLQACSLGLRAGLKWIPSRWLFHIPPAWPTMPLCSCPMALWDSCYPRGRGWPPPTFSFKVKMVNSCYPVSLWLARARESCFLLVWEWAVLLFTCMLTVLPFDLC